MKKNLKENAKTLGISIGYLSQILSGKKGCNEELMLNIKYLYPELDFTLLNPRYILRKDKNKHNYMEQEYNNLLELYNIRSKDFEKTDMRNQKAIEYIRNKVGTEIHDMMYVIDVSDVLDILRGDE